MSKRILTVVLVLGTLAASSAYADRARDLVLGTGDGGVMLGDGGSSGTFYTDDAYNVFYNPAYVNDYKNWAIIEKSNFSNAGNQVTAGKSITGTTAQGGFVTGIGNFNLMLFFNRQDALQDAIYGVSNASQGVMRPIDVIFGGDTGMMKWGLGLTYSSFSAADPNNANATKTSNDFLLHFGAEVMDFDPFVNWRISGTDNSLGTGNSNVNQPQNKGLEAGLRYHWGEWTPFAAYKYTSYSGATDYRAYGIGFGRTMKATESVKLMYSLAWFRETVGVNSFTAGNVAQAPNNGTATDGDRTVIPLNVSVEGDANSWLTLRAGLGYNFMDRVNNTTVADNTSGRIGATAHAGKVDFDFAVGANGNGSELASSTNSQNFDFTSGLFSAASVQYHW